MPRLFWNPRHARHDHRRQGDRRGRPARSTRARRIELAARGPAPTRASRSSSSATIPPRRSTCATSARPARNAASSRSATTCPHSTTQAELSALIERLNADDTIDGILVQVPLPDAHRPGARHRDDRSGQGRRRLPSLQRRPPRAAHPDDAAVHALRRDRTARNAAVCEPKGKDAVVVGAVQHRRPADGARAAARGLDRHGVPQHHGRSG